MTGQNEAFSRVLIDKALEFSGWNLLDPQQVVFRAAHHEWPRRLSAKRPARPRSLCARSEARRPRSLRRQGTGARLCGKPKSAARHPFQRPGHWFWNYERADQRDAYRIERLPSRDDLERVRLKELATASTARQRNCRSGLSPSFKHDLLLRRYQINALDDVCPAVRHGRPPQIPARNGHRHRQNAPLRRPHSPLPHDKQRRARSLHRRSHRTRETDAWRISRSSCPNTSPVIFKTARRSGELLGSSVVVATIQSLMVDRRYRAEFTPFYFDLVINDEAHRSIYGDAREVVQFFQATRIGLTATPKAYLSNVNIERLASENPKALEARQLRDTYHYFGCEPGSPPFATTSSGKEALAATQPRSALCVYRRGTLLQSKKRL